MTTRQVPSVVVSSAACLPGYSDRDSPAPLFTDKGPNPDAYRLRGPNGPVAIISDTGSHIATDTFPATNLDYEATSKSIATSGVSTVGVEGTSSY